MDERFCTVLRELADQRADHLLVSPFSDIIEIKIEEYHRRVRLCMMVIEHILKNDRGENGFAATGYSIQPQERALCIYPFGILIASDEP